MKTTDRIRSWEMFLKSSRWINKYTVTLAIFCVWMMFFDKHNMIVRYQLQRVQNSLQQQMDYDGQRLQAVKEEQRELELDLEKYAREKYLMHRSDEEVFVVVEE